MKNKIYFIIFIGIFLFITFSNKQTKISLEERQVPLGVGIDLNQNRQGDFYNATVSTYIYENPDNILTKTREGAGETFGNSRQNRQLTEDKQYLTGQEKLYIISEDYAKYGMKSFFDFIFRNTLINDKASVVICEGSAKDIFNMKMKNYISPLEFIDGLITVMPNQHFSSREYLVIDVYTRLNSKYRNLMLPYISIVKDKVEVKGYALFDEDKMKINVDSDEGKIINLLKEDSGYGMITVLNNPSNALDLYGTCKRKVSCNKKEDNYNFTINLDLKLVVVTNELNNDLINDIKVSKNFENLAKKQIEDNCLNFINKMQNIYKVDYLDLKRDFVAKYGRDTNIDLNELVSNSKIDVKAKVTITNFGRGEY